MGLVITDIISEFGQYTISKKQQIVADILKPSNIDKFCTPVTGVEGVYQMTTAEVGELTQPFQKAWTPKGVVTFKPSEITMRNVKVDFEFEPHDMQQKWHSYLTSEGITDLTAWPLSRFILEKLTSKVVEERGLTAIDGVYSAPTPGTAGAREDSFDGFLELLTDIETNATGNDIPTGALSGATPYDSVRAFIRAIPAEVMRACGNKIFCSNAIVDEVYDDYEDNNPNKELKMGSEEKSVIIKGTGVTLVGLDNMGSSERLFTTPKWNMLKLSGAIDKVGKFDIQQDKRVLNVLTNYLAAYGFGFDKFVYHNDQA